MLRRANKRYEDQRNLKYVKWEAIEASEAFKKRSEGKDLEMVAAGHSNSQTLTECQLVFEMHMSELGFIFQREYKFRLERGWRADYLVSRTDRHNALIEFEGGAWTRGRHVRGKGFIADLEKYNVASGMGYKVFRFTPQQVLRGEAKEFIARWL